MRGVRARKTEQIYFSSFGGAADAARERAESRGYTIDENDWFTQISTGGRYTRARPSKGKTHKFVVGLEKNGKPQKKALIIIVYGMPSGNYELTDYIN